MKTKPAILVAGGAGYIGSHIAQVLAAEGYLPVSLDNLVTGNQWALRYGPYAIGLIADRNLVLNVVRGHRISAVILLAAHAYVGESTGNPSKYYRNNVSASLDFLDALIEADVRRMILSSSCSVYGMQQKVPISEDSRMDPLSPYAESKAFLEGALRWYDRAYGLRHVSLRYFNAAGASPTGDLGECHIPETHLIPLTIAAALGGSTLAIYGNDYSTPDGTAIRDYIHVADLADAHLRALAYLLDGGDSTCFNCGTGNGTSVSEVIRAVQSVSGRTVNCDFRPRRFGDAPVLVADARRIGHELGWRPRLSSIETIVSTAWRWHSSNRQR
jgi:UDP-glucose-4-epimerase GalE